MNHPRLIAIFVAATAFTTSCLNLSTDGAVFACPDCVTADAGAMACDCPLPAPTCKGATRLEALSARCGDDGSCRYASSATACPQGCAEGACLGDTCLGVVCRSPPAPACLNAQTLRWYAPMGTCAHGGCNYTAAEQSCACADNRCTFDMCAGVSCHQAPPAVCVGNTLRSFSLQGTCEPQSGTCAYFPTETPCPFGCADGQCMQDKCAGQSCAEPPAANCLDATHVRTYGSAGRCDSTTGNCAYTETVTPCRMGQTCSQGHCGTQPPQCNASNCTGCCNGATCIALVSQSDLLCGTGGDACGGCGPTAPRCTSGTCQSLCTGVSCNAPPRVVCASATSRRVYDATGSCIAADGGCAYNASEQACPAMYGCDAGTCVPIAVPDAGVQKTWVSSGGTQSCAVKTDGTLWCWGANDEGQLGNGSTAASTTPVALQGNSWAQVSAGPAHSCALKRDGSLWCWGANAEHQTSSLSATVLRAPEQVPGSWKWVSAGYKYTLAITSGGKLWAWGLNTSGELGTGNTNNVLSPVQVGTANWAMVFAGAKNSCGIQSDGSLWCWGNNDTGQLGVGSTSSSTQPVLTSSASWLSVTVGGAHSCGTKSDNTLWCWGGNEYGQLGVGAVGGSDRLAPVQVPGTAWKQVFAGNYHTCAVKTGGSLWCWGEYANGQLGHGGCGTEMTSDCAEPTQVSGSTWDRIDFYSDNVCGSKADGSAWCWGENNFGQSGNGTTHIVTVPYRVLAP